MPTTTNYGWTTPADTDLVKDGASAIRTLGSSIDTTTKNLNPSTTLGDIEYRSSTSNTNTRLPIGSNGQILTVSSGVPAWAAGGGTTLISTTTLSGASVVLSSIPQTYYNLQLQIENYQPATDGANLILRFNANSNTVYKNVTTNSADSADTFMGMDATSIKITGQNDSTVARSNSIVNVFNYSNSTIYGLCTVVSLNTDSGNTDGIRLQHSVGVFSVLDAITSITLLSSSGNLTAGTVKLYGVK